MEAGADDVVNEGEIFIVYTSPVSMHKVKEIIIAAGIAVEAFEVSFQPNTTIALEHKGGEKIMRLINALEDNEDVQNVSHNAEIPESVEV